MTIADSHPPDLNPETPLAEIALLSDGRAAVLARHGLDFCCGGRRTLSQACATAGLDIRLVFDDLEAEISAGAEATAPDWNQRPVDELIDFIVGTHHAFTRRAIARITPLLAKVAAKHGERRPALLDVARTFGELAAEMEPHMLREERVLFPYIRLLASPGPAPAAPFGTVRTPVRMMLSEHDRAADQLAFIYDATAGLSPPADACASYRALYSALAELRLDLMRHVSLENNVLFPRALAMEDARRAAPASPQLRG
jgi:regulator of cell morphogenesis and NO signaling